MYTTLELCRNIAAGPHGSLELIVSNPKYEQPTFFFWPLSANGDIEPSQLEDLQVVLWREVTDTIVGRLMVQPQLFTGD